MTIFWPAAAYFLGSIPSGFLIGRYVYHVNLKKQGSCNIGATNAYRVIGFPAAALVFACDFAKGAAAVWLGEPRPIIMVLCAFMAIVGNNWSVFLHFKSGRGVACGVGAFTWLFPWATAAAFAVWILVFAAKRIVSLARLLRRCSAAGPFPDGRTQRICCLRHTGSCFDYCTA